MTEAVPIPVCIFAKPPVPGEVKTRLIPVVGAAGAADLARAMLLDVWRTVKSCAGIRAIVATTMASDFPVAISPRDVWLQGEGDLGQRIERILTRALLQAPAAMAVGADSPTLTAAHIYSAVRALQTNDAVLGPSMDGGFYLFRVTSLSRWPVRVPAVECFRDAATGESASGRARVLHRGTRAALGYRYRWRCYIS